MKHYQVALYVRNFKWMTILKMKMFFNILTFWFCIDKCKWFCIVCCGLCMNIKNVMNRTTELLHYIFSSFHPKQCDNATKVAVSYRERKNILVRKSMKSMNFLAWINILLAMIYYFYLNFWNCVSDHVKTNGSPEGGPHSQICVAMRATHDNQLCKLQLIEII